ncbi:MAG: HNH endonuclease signature motif containing protein [Planctomycetota bacterium]|nr:HNH endonuclease signature motif containing protein [Planctomycetota bacterium]
MSSYVSAGLRREVQRRARGICEYCLIHERDTYLGCQVDHVVSERHGGATESGNLAYACTCCNCAKGTDVGSIAASGDFARFFNPRVDRWADHFKLRGVFIDPQTPIGEVTARILGLNEPERIMERQLLLRLGRYPSPSAARLIAGGPADQRMQASGDSVRDEG